MIINTDNPVITFSDKGKPFAYDKIFFATVEKYILDYKNAKIERLTEADAAKCLARIFNKMEVNGVPIKEFFAEEFEQWKNLDQYKKVMNITELVARDIFCCFDKNRYDENGDFAVTDRIYSIVTDGKPDYIYAEDFIKEGMFSKKKLSPESAYFKQLMDFNKAGKLPKKK